ncbi:MAG TPA: hypothetical protein VFB06_27420, partial [Streptosporangiaceae bacterium]|nr:hypothetical protein [Streptosporangiaceae bacterium]
MTRRRNNVADQPQTRSPDPAATRHNRRSRHPILRNKRSLDLARLNPETAQLNLRVRTPQKLQNTVRPPPRQVPGPVHPFPGRPIRARHKPLRRQPGAARITTRNTQTRYVKLPNNPNRYRLKTTVQHIRT